MPAVSARIALAVGPDAIEDNSFRLPPLTLSPPVPMRPDGPHPDSAFVVELEGSAPLARIALVYALEDSRRRDSLVGAAIWGKTWDGWIRLDAETGGPCREYQTLALAWTLASVAGESLGEIAETLGRYASGAGALGQTFGVRALPWDKPADAAWRALTLRRLRSELTAHVELSLRATGGPWPSRRVWRELLGLGLRWGSLDLFHAFDDAGNIPVFTVSSLGVRSDFSPERAAEGETISGVTLGFELAACPAPLAVFDRMALALAFLRERWGGAPTRGAKPLDGEALEACRREIETTVALLCDAGIAPGSPDALALL